MARERLGVEDFAALFGAAVDELPDDALKIIAQHDFSYDTLSPKDEVKVNRSILARIDEGELSIAGPAGKGRWDKGWGENLDAFRRSDGDVGALVPKYIREGQPLRLNQRYVMPTDPAFELHWYGIFRLWLARTFLSDASAIYEFGCGSGHNLAALATLFPDKHYYGLDWAQASADIVDELGKRNGWKMHGQVFDFFEPSKDFALEPGAVVFTIGAMEQTGTGYRSFIDYLLEQSPRLCVNIEPISEWYDRANPIDDAAARFHLHRKYWTGFPGLIDELEAEGRIQVVKRNRTHFGSLYIEGYSQVIWRPTGKR